MTGKRQIGWHGWDAGDRKVPGRKWDFAVGPQKEVPGMHGANTSNAREDRKVEKRSMGKLGNRHSHNTGQLRQMNKQITAGEKHDMAYSTRTSE